MPNVPFTCRSDALIIANSALHVVTTFNPPKSKIWHPMEDTEPFNTVFLKRGKDFNELKNNMG